jgi:hypothetical protein
MLFPYELFIGLLWLTWMLAEKPVNKSGFLIVSAVWET